MLTYIRKKPSISRNAITSYHLSPNIALKGQPTANTADINESNNRLATTEFVNRYMSNFANKYNVTTINNYQTNTSFQHVTSSVYYIHSQSNLIVEKLCTLYLPTNIVEGMTITVVNRSGLQITIYSDPNDTMYNSLYLPPQGGTFLTLDANRGAYFTYIHNNTTGVKSWHISVY